MPVDCDELIQVVAAACDEKEMRVCFSESLKGAAYSGVSSAVGGLLMGPVGLAVGAALGGIMAAVSAKGKFQPVCEILVNMNGAKKQVLVEKLMYAFRNFDAKDIIALIALIQSEAACRDLALTVVKNFLTKYMHGTVTY